MTKKNCLKILVMLGLTLLAMVVFTNNVEAATEDPYALCIFSAYTTSGDYIEAMGQGDYEYQELTFNTKNITSDFYYQFNTAVNLGETMTLEGLGKFTLSRTYTGQSDSKTYYEYKSEIKNIETIKTGKQTYNYNFIDIDNNMPHPFTLDLTFVRQEDLQKAQDIANKYDHYLITKYINFGEDMGSRTEYAIEVLDKLVNDNSVKFVANGGGSGGAGGLGITGGGEIGLDIYVNNVNCGNVTVQSYFMYQVIVPASVEDTEKAYIDYALPKIKSFMKENSYSGNIDSLELEKITGYYYKAFLPNEENARDEIVIKKQEGTPVGNNIFVDNLEKGLNIIVTEKQNATMENEIKNKGYTNILGSYELKLEGATKLLNPVEITFNVGTEHNGKTVYILHQKQNGTYENFEEKVANGKVSVTVSELSPFVLALKEGNTQTETPQEQEKQDEQTENTTNEHIKDETPKTGTNDISTIICSILSVLSAAGIAIVKKF